MSVTDTSTEAPELILEQVSCIQYPVKFRKDKETVHALINFGSEMNDMISAYAAVLGFEICSISIRAQKIDWSSLKIFGMVIASFQLKNKLGRDWFFWETFPLANINMKVILVMLFLTFGNADA